MSNKNIQKIFNFFGLIFIVMVRGTGIYLNFKIKCKTKQT